MAALKLSVACPVCNERIEADWTSDVAYGFVRIDDVACAEVTINDGGAVNAHMNEHRLDGTWIAAYEKWLGQMQERATGYFDRKAAETH